MQSITVKVPEELKARLQSAAEGSGQSVSALLRQMAERITTGSCAGSAFEKSMSLCGSLSLGPKAARSQDYLKQYGKARPH